MALCGTIVFFGLFHNAGVQVPSYTLMLHFSFCATFSEATHLSAFSTAERSDLKRGQLRSQLMNPQVKSDGNSALPLWTIDRVSNSLKLPSKTGPASWQLGLLGMFFVGCIWNQCVLAFPSHQCIRCSLEVAFPWSANEPFGRFHTTKMAYLAQFGFRSGEGTLDPHGIPDHIAWLAPRSPEKSLLFDLLLPLEFLGFSIGCGADVLPPLWMPSHS